MVAGQVKVRGKDGRKEPAKVEGETEKLSGNPVERLPDWHADAAVGAGRTPLRGADASGHALPVAGDDELRRCRLHGGASPGAPRGAGNGMWRHGLRSIETIERRREMTAAMRRIRREISAGLR